jgi:hypothetical protein
VFFGVDLIRKISPAKLYHRAADIACEIVPRRLSALIFSSAAVLKGQFTKVADLSRNRLNWLRDSRPKRRRDWCPQRFGRLGFRKGFPQ